MVNSTPPNGESARSTCRNSFASRLRHASFTWHQAKSKGEGRAAPNVGCVLKLSVIVPFYNVRQYVPDALRSLRANARDDFEFILVDDCSTDGTADLLARAERELPGAVLVRHERNGGLATARNTGLDRARGEYVTFLDGDDWLAPGYYARLVAAIEGWAATSCAPTTCSARAVPFRPPGPARAPQRRAEPAGGDPARPPLHVRRLRLRLGRDLPPEAGRPRPAPLHRRAAHGRGPAVDLEAAPGGGVLRGDRSARRLLPARGRLVADPDRGRPPARLHPRLRPGRRGDRAGRGRRAAAAEGRAHLLRHHFPSPRFHRKVRAARGPEAEGDERRRAAAHAAGRPRRGAGLDGHRARHPAAPAAPPSGAGRGVAA